jgi:hypothetical protein
MPSIDTQTDSFPSYTALDTWYGRLTPEQQEFARKNWGSLMEVAEHHLQDALDNEFEEQARWEREDVYDYVERVDDLLGYTVVQVGEEGWTEAYREYCADRPLESLPKFPAEGFRMYAQKHKPFFTKYQGDAVIRETEYFQTMGGGDGCYAEKGYFVVNLYTNSQHCYGKQIYKVARKPLGSFEMHHLAGAEVDIEYNKSGKPITIGIRQKK